MIFTDKEGIEMGSVCTPGLNARVMSLIAEASRDFDLRFPAAIRIALTKWSDSSFSESSDHWLPKAMADDLGSSVMVTLSDGLTTLVLGDTSRSCRMGPRSLCFVVVLPAQGRPFITMMNHSLMQLTLALYHPHA